MSLFDLVIRLGLAWFALTLARKRGRSVLLWPLATFFLIFPVFILLFLPPALFQKTRTKRAPREEAFAGETLEVKPLAKGEPSSDAELANFDRQSWYQLGKGRKSEGPFPFEELRRRFWEGEVSEESYVWTPLWKEWKRVSSIPGFLRALSK